MNDINDPKRQTQLVDAESGIPLNPLAGFSTATLSANGALLTIEFLLPPPATEPGILRLGMTRAQCSDLAKTLKRLAILPHKPQSQPS